MTSSSPAHASAASRQTLMVLSLAMMGAVVMIAAVTFIVLPLETPPVWTIAVVAALVLAGVALAVVGARSLGALPPGAGETEAWNRVRAVHLTRLVVLEAPAIAGIVLGFLVDSWWLVAGAAAASVLAMVVLAVPHRAVLARYEAALNAEGASVRLTA